MQGPAQRTFGMRPCQLLDGVAFKPSLECQAHEGIAGTGLGQHSQVNGKGSNEDGQWQNDKEERTEEKVLAECGLRQGVGMARCGY